MLFGQTWLIESTHTCRFFYEHIWREWDEDDDGDYSYAGRHLESRLRLYYDMCDGSIPKESIQRYQGVLMEQEVKMLFFSF